MYSGRFSMAFNSHLLKLLNISKEEEREKGKKKKVCHPSDGLDKIKTN
jgi:hypothetical protein